MSAFSDVGEIGPQPLAEGVLARAVHGELLTLSLVELEPDAEVPEHRHANEQVGILVEGTITLRIGEETRELAQGATWRIAAHAPHHAVAGPEGAVIVEVFAPPRRDWDVLETLQPGLGRWP